MTLRLSAPEPQHLEALYRWYNDPQQWRNTLSQGIVSMHMLQEYVLSYTDDIAATGQALFIIEHDATAVGVAELCDYSARNATAFVGIYLDPAYRRRGLGRLTLQALDMTASARYGIRSLAAVIAADNTASLKLFASARYELRGSLDNWLTDGPVRKAIKILQHNL